MSSLQVFTQAAMSRHFDFVDFDPRAGVSQLAQKLPQMPKLAGVTPASRLEVRAAPEMVSSGIAEIDSLTGGLPRGCLAEICGPASSGRTSLLLAAMAAATQREEVCALVDTCDALNPQSAAAAGMDLEKMLWVRCSSVKRTKNRHEFNRATSSKSWVSAEHKNDRGEFFALEDALRVTDLLLQSSGFGMVVIDLGDISYRAVRRVPLTSWFRFRRAVENTNTVLLVSSRQACAQSCASLLLQLEGRVSGVRRSASGDRDQDSEQISAINFQLSAKNNEAGRVPTHAQILGDLAIRAEVLRSRLERKPVRSVTATFMTKAARSS